ncbi:MAG: fatty acyl-AMP ligase [Planctomycetota bacterium]|nr:fatty acyl-AMP ligase [Planctomycetota bacterium]
MTSPPGSLIPNALEQAARTDRGIHLVGRGTDHETLPYRSLAEMAAKGGVALTESGIEPGDRVLLVLPTGKEFLKVFFACQRIGAIPCPLSPPAGFGSRELFARRLQQLVTLVDAQVVVTSEEWIETVDAASPAPTRCSATLSGNSPPLPLLDRNPESTSFIQFTSGTTEIPKGVELSHQALIANVQQIASASDITSESVIVSWLPLHHDMGLIGGVLTALVNQADLVLSAPMTFLRRPRTWLEHLTRFSGTHSPAPTFAYATLLDRLRPEDLEGIDLSSWKVAYVGAEPIPATTLRSVQKFLSPCGLSPSTLLPCYGLAESCLAVTFSPWGKPFQTLAASRRILAESGSYHPPESPSDEQMLVSCGLSVPGTQVTIRDPDSSPCPEGQIGEIWVEGPALYRGYHGQSPRPEHEPLATGDLGFLLDRNLYVTGRAKDLIILRGENHHPAEIEWALKDIRGLRKGRAAAFGVSNPRQGTETLCLVAELDRRASVNRESLAEHVQRRVQEGTGLWVDKIQFVPSGTIPVTTSGKIQRSLVRRQYLNSQQTSQDDHS